MASQASGFSGSWRLILCPATGTERHLSFASFMDGGIMMTSPPPVEQFPLTPGGVVFVSTGHGVWQSDNNHSAVLTFSAQATDGQGAVVGVGTVTASMELTGDGQGFAGTYAFEMADSAGQIFATEQGRVEAARIVVLDLNVTAPGARSAA
jgi:hypothetical protein